MYECKQLAPEPEDIVTHNFREGKGGVVIFGSSSNLLVVYDSMQKTFIFVLNKKTQNKMIILVQMSKNYYVFVTRKRSCA